jgi:hypothetical protein
MRIDSHTKLNLEGNPYINNMVHKAVWVNINFTHSSFF